MSERLSEEELVETLIEAERNGGVCNEHVASMARELLAWRKAFPNLNVINPPKIDQYVRHNAMIGGRSFQGAEWEIHSADCNGKERVV